MPVLNRRFVDYQFAIYGTPCPRPMLLCYFATEDSNSVNTSTSFYVILWCAVLVFAYACVLLKLSVRALFRFVVTTMRYTIVHVFIVLLVSKSCLWHWILTISKIYHRSFPKVTKVNNKYRAIVSRQAVSLIM